MAARTLTPAPGGHLPGVRALLWAAGLLAVEAAAVAGLALWGAGGPVMALGAGAAGLLALGLAAPRDRVWRVRLGGGLAAAIAAELAWAGGLHLFQVLTVAALTAGAVVGALERPRAATTTLPPASRIAHRGDAPLVVDATGRGVGRWLRRLGVGFAAGLVVPALAWVALGLWQARPEPVADPPRVVAGPDAEALDAALGSAQAYLDGLLRPIAPGRTAMTEYAALPVLGRFAQDPRLALPGLDGSRAFPVATRPAVDVQDVRLVGTQGQDARLRVFADWTAGPGWVRVSLRAERLRLLAPLRVSVARRASVVFAPGDQGRTRVLELPLGERDDFAAVRYTLRHATNEAAHWTRAIGDPRAATLTASSRQAGFGHGDLYDVLWNAAPRRSASWLWTQGPFADCAHAHERGSDSYVYRSKVCRAPGLYRWLSTFDPLTVSLAALTSLRQHGPDAHVPWMGRRDPTVREVARDLERESARAAVGTPECSPVGCDASYASTVRTATFGLLEATLGYGFGDPRSRRWADWAARRVLAAQIPRSGVLRTADGTYTRPLQGGGFAVGVRPDGRYGLSATPLGRAAQDLSARVGMPGEFYSAVASNAETTLGSVAFLAGYRCLARRVGCDGPGGFTAAPLTPARPVPAASSLPRVAPLVATAPRPDPAGVR